MLGLAAVAALIYAFINGFGAWMVVRRKPWVAAWFMVAASVLIIAAASLIYTFDYTRVLLGAGLFLASAASFINAHIVLGNVVWRFHVIRAFVGIAIYTVAYAGLTWL